MRRGIVFGGSRSLIPHSPELIAWETRKGEPKSPSFEQIYEEWSESLLAVKETAKANLYDCAEALTHGDLWMHRLLITQSILDIQLQILDKFADDFAGKEFDARLPELLTLVEKEIAELVDTLHEWHGSPQNQGGVPVEFINSMEEAVSGNVEDFDRGLHDRSGKLK